jgi:hypothetical protein
MIERKYKVEIKVINNRGENLTRTFCYNSGINLLNEVENIKEILENSRNYKF